MRENQKITRKWLFSLLLLVFSAIGFAQQLKISGVVIDSQSKEALIGVNVIIQGTKAGTITDLDGKFTISVPIDAELTFTYVGYNKQKVKINNNTSVQIELVSIASELEDVVVIGYGEVKKRDLTGSVGSVKKNELSKIPSSSVAGTLTGRVAGLQTTQTSGGPGNEPIIRIRGGNSINGSNDPLWVIDGFISAGGANSIPIEDIETIEVLKDASSTAIYGARGANGVIIITTKKGSKGELNVTLKTYVGAEWMDRELPLMNNTETLKYWRAFDPNYFDANINESTNFDWVKEVTRTALNQNYYLSINGGNNGFTYNVSGEFMKNEGILKYNSDFTRANIRTVFDFNLTKKIKAGFTTRYRQGVENNVANGAFFQTILTMSPLVSAYDENGNYNLKLNPINLNDQNGIDLYKNNGVGVKGNPIQMVKERNRPTTNALLNLQTYLNIELLKSLILRSELSFTKYNSWEKSYSPSTLDNMTPASLGHSESQAYEWINTLTYKKKVNKVHDFNAVIGQTIQSGNSLKVSAGNMYFATDGFEWNNLGAGTPVEMSNMKVSSNYSEAAILSYLARINYIYNDKYLFTLSGRADGSSKFSKNKKWSYFPSGAFSWRANEEEFINNLNIFDNLKFRTSYGITGSEAINSYQTLGLMNTGTSFFNSSATSLYGSTTTLYRPFTIANDNLTWETTAQFDFGVDMGFFKNRLAIAFDFYNKDTYNLLLMASMPLESGYDVKLSNVGEVNNKGFEALVNAHIIKSESFNWNSDLTFSLNRNKVVSLGNSTKIDQASGTDYTETLYLEVGKPVSIIYGYVTDGVWQNAQDIANYPHRASDRVGDFRIVDTNSDGKIESNDKVAIGNPNPKFTFGWNNNFSFKNFELSFFFSGAYGHDVLNFNKHKLMVDNPRLQELVNYWTPQNQSNNYTSPGNTNVAKVIDKYVEDASFIRLKNATLKYNFSKKLLRKIGINSLSIYTTGTNLFLLTKYSGTNPEANQSGNSNTKLGVDYSTYPTSKSIVGGLTLNF